MMVVHDCERLAVLMRCPAGCGEMFVSFEKSDPGLPWLAHFRDVHPSLAHDVDAARQLEQKAHRRRLDQQYNLGARN